VATPIPENRARFTSTEIAQATGGALRGPPVVAEGLTTDTRVARARPGGVFVALVGERLDGHDFLASVDGHAAVVVCARGRGAILRESAVVEVDDTLVAWAALAEAHLAAWRGGAELPTGEHEAPARRTVCVTGSAGKTTTKELTAALLASAGTVQRTRGNLNNRVGMPATALTVDASHRFAVLELGMSIPGEIRAMAAAARPDVAIITNIGVAHAEGVGGRVGVAREKGDLVAHLRPDGVAVLNADCDYLGVLHARSTGARVVTFGRAAHADYRLVERAVEPREGSVLTIARAAEGSRGEAPRPLRVRFPLLGEHAAIDLLAALAAAEAALGVPLAASDIEAAVPRAELHGRGSLQVLANGAWVIDDSYNANPGSMAAALSALAEQGAGRRRIAVLGEMRELGALAEAEHDALAARVLEAHVDLFVSCGGLISRTAALVRAAGVPTFDFIDAEEAATFVTSVVVSSDIVLVKGSRSIATERVVAALARSFGGPGTSPERA
jgi:UDP-N-acetylmuramoyl-tripeptide--D-alanyl-D-alanine ligase